MERVASKEEARQALSDARRDGATIGFVPTMGALHEGHLSLVRASRQRTDVTAVSIFVNPTQFGEGEDFAAYPRDLDRDLELLAAEGVDVVFMPSAGEMYAPDASVTIDPGGLADVLEGYVRPGHFRGVATVVAKLLSITRPDAAFFGEKDYQQLKIIQRLVIDLDLAVTIVPCPTIRDCDGLALSSRNAYLTADQRADALVLPGALEAAAHALAWGERSGSALEAVMAEEFAAHPSVLPDYAVVVDADTLARLGTVEGPARALVAARVGSTRLIDNAPLVPPTRTT